ncbi:MAG: hypothetical protein JRI33_06450 [Deltaproteobacteria bacterium]|nr:hypothetical protein [Deltaproteobacteria bacterium]
MNIDMTQAGSRPGHHVVDQRPDQPEVFSVPEPDQLGCPVPGFDSPGGEQFGIAGLLAGDPELSQILAVIRQVMAELNPMGHGAPSGFFVPSKGHGKEA